VPAAGGLSQQQAGVERQHALRAPVNPGAWAPRTALAARAGAPCPAPHVGVRTGCWVLGQARLRAARREVAKAVRARKARVVLVAPNIEPIAAQGGLDDQLDDILRTAEGNGTPVVFCGSRKKLGQARAPPRPPPHARPG